MTELAVGDWVVVAAWADTALRGLGKLVEGEVDPWADAFLQARVETPAGEEGWVAAADLARVAPVDECDLVERALAEGLVPEALVEELRTRLWRVRLGAVEYERSPGLLDRLRSGLATSPAPDRLEAFFAGGQGSLDRARRQRSRPDGRPPAEAAASPPLPLAEAQEEGQPLPTPATLLEAIDRVLRIRGTRGIKDICRRLQLPQLAHRTADATAHALHNHGVTLHPLLRALPATHLKLAPDALGLPDVTGDTEQELVEALVAELEPILARAHERRGR